MSTAEVTVSAKTPVAASPGRGGRTDTLPQHAVVVELADRHSNDLSVFLLWARFSGRLWVDVVHRRTGRVARIEATPANALDVFNHPFAYAPAA